MKLWILLGFILLLIFIVLTDKFRKEKTAEYKNDERWQQVRVAANSVVMKFYNLLVGVVCLGFFAVDIFVTKLVSIPLENILLYASFILMLRYPIEYFALLFFDREM